MISGLLYWLLVAYLSLSIVFTIGGVLLGYIAYKKGAFQ